jgi:hypothetical protein
MAVGKPYDEVLAAAEGIYVPGEGTRSAYKVLENLGYSYEFKNGKPVGDIMCKSRIYGITGELYRDFCWGRPCLLTVPSLNIVDGHHMVYYDGHEVYDPNPPEKKRYTEFNDLLPSEVIFFRPVVAPTGEVPNAGQDN